MSDSVFVSAEIGDGFKHCDSCKHICCCCCRCFKLFFVTVYQSWADAFRGAPELKAVESIYQELRSKGIEFPATDMDQMAPIHTPKVSRSYDTCITFPFCLLLHFYVLRPRHTNIRISAKLMIVVLSYYKPSLHACILGTG